MSHGWLLYVEDAEPNRLLMDAAFERAAPSLKLETVPDGEKALTYLSGTGPYADRQNYPLPDLVLLDLKLPGKSDHEVLAWIRRQPAFHALPVAILSSSSQPEDVKKAYAAGANWYLAKSPPPWQAWSRWCVSWSVARFRRRGTLRR